MTIKECYEIFGGDYDDVLERMVKESLVQKFALKFLNDPSYSSLSTAMAQKNQQEAFRAAHTIKGVCQNLGFTRLYESSNLLTQELRNSWGDNAEDLFLQVQKDYSDTVEAIKKYQSEA